MWILLENALVLKREKERKRERDREREKKKGAKEKTNIEGVT